MICPVSCNVAVGACIESRQSHDVVRCRPRDQLAGEDEEMWRMKGRRGQPRQSLAVCGGPSGDGTTELMTVIQLLDGAGPCRCACVHWYCYIVDNGQSAVIEVISRLTTVQWHACNCMQLACSCMQLLPSFVSEPHGRKGMAAIPHDRFKFL